MVHLFKVLNSQFIKNLVLNHLQITALQSKIEPLRQAIIKHKVYSVIQSIEDLQIFMKYHVYAVWDFMSLLKSLQQQLTCTSLPWVPVGTASTRFLINEIVVGEESDVDANGFRKSHFELYLDAMNQSGAPTEEIVRFVDLIKSGKSIEYAFEMVNTPLKARDFVYFTFDVIQHRKAFAQAAIFTFGREDLIPGMFLSMIQDMYQHHPEQISSFKYYLDRHIEVDGDHHSHLALEMTAELCGEDENIWREVELITKQSLEKRIALWDAVYDEITHKKTAAL